MCGEFCLMLDKQLLREKITAFVEHDSANYWHKGLRFFDPPLLGYARVDDPLFQEMKKKEIGGGMFRPPVEWLEGAVSVISYFLPFTEAVRRSNDVADEPSKNWLYARFEGEKLNNRLRKFIVDELAATGLRAVAPLLEDEFTIDHHLLVSNWSERHAAYAAGLGTFSLSRGLITARGIAGRFGSIITAGEYTPLPRDYSFPFQYCSWLREGLCGSCIKRCPAGAISEDGMNKELCRQYLHQKDSLQKLREEHGYPYSACGKCQIGVSCEGQIPSSATG